MIEEGDVVLFRFPQTDLQEGKLRPALVIKRLHGEYDDWLICMISSRIYQYNEELDEIITPKDNDFQDSGLKTESVIRVSRLAVVEKKILIGRIGKISSDRLGTKIGDTSHFSWTGRFKNRKCPYLNPPINQPDLRTAVSN